MPIAVFNGVDEPIWSRSRGGDALHADTHQQMSELRPLGIGIEIQLPDLGGAGKAAAAAHSDGRRLSARFDGLSDACVRCLVCGQINGGIE